MLLKGKPAADALIEKLAALNPPKLTLAVFHSAGDASAESYLKAKEKTLSRLGFRLEVVTFARDITREQFWPPFDKVNRDPAIHGVMVETPVPATVSVEEIASRINPRKDVDGISAVNQGVLYATREERLVPCTAMGAVVLLEHYGVALNGKRVLVVGRSATVGLPLFKLLLNRNATVTVAHSKTPHLENLVKEFEVIAVAAGKAGLIRSSSLSDGATVVDIGINVGTDGSLCGDLLIESPGEEKRIHYSPVPGGAGVVTNAVLLHNLVMCHKLQQEG